MFIMSDLPEDPKELMKALKGKMDYAIPGLAWTNPEPESEHRPELRQE